MNPDTTYIKKPSDRAEWLKTIQPYIGGSEVGALAGVSKFKTAIDLFLEKTGRKPQRDEPNEAMLLGTYLEEYAARRYSQKTGNTVRNYNYVVVRGHARADVDRLVVPSGEKVASHHEEIRAAGIVECKAVRDEWDGEVPLYYQTQAQLYCELLELPWTDFSVVFKSTSVHACPADPGWEFLRVYRDAAVGAELYRRIEKFYADAIARDDVGMASSFVRSLDDARALFPCARTDATVEASADVAAMVTRLRTIVDQQKELDEEADGLKGAVAAAMGEADTLVRNGVKLCTFRAPKPRKSTDWKAVASELGRTEEPSHVAAIVAANTTETPSSRRFVLCAK